MQFLPSLKCLIQPKLLYIRSRCVKYSRGGRDLVGVFIFLRWIHIKNQSLALGWQGHITTLLMILHAVVKCAQSKLRGRYTTTNCDCSRCKKRHSIDPHVSNKSKRLAKCHNKMESTWHRISGWCVFGEFSTKKMFFCNAEFLGKV